MRRGRPGRDRPEHGGVGGRDVGQRAGRRWGVGRAVPGEHGDLKLLLLLAVARGPAGEVEHAGGGYVEEGVAVAHVQDRIRDVAGVVGLPRHLDHRILARRVQEPCIWVSECVIFEAFDPTNLLRIRPAAEFRQCESRFDAGGGRERGGAYRGNRPA